MSDQTFSTEELSAMPFPLHEYSQLYQTRVPLDEAADVFNTRDANGRIPIVIIPKRMGRISNELVIAAIVVAFASIAAQIAWSNWIWTGAGMPIALVLLVLGVYRSFIVRIPEGANALMTKGGRYYRTISSGIHYLPPWILVSHLVTRRQIPFDAPVLESPTRDYVRANVDMLVTFTITDPYRFIYSIAPDDFDQVFLAACQDALRAMVRKINSDQVVDLTRKSTEDLAQAISADVESYGVTIHRANITYAGPPIEFVQSLEAQKLAILQRKEQAEKQALDLQRQADQDELARQAQIARVVREREALQIQVQAAEIQQRIVDLQAQAEDLRLAKLEQRLKKYPQAARWEVESAQLEIARSLAGNTRAVVQVGQGSDITRAFLLSDTLQGEGKLTPPPDAENPEQTTKKK